VEGLVLCATASDFTISGLEYVTVCSAFVAIAFTRLVPPVFHSGFDLVGRFVVGPMDDPGAPLGRLGGSVASRR
jgi:hypothetical protein